MDEDVRVVRVLVGGAPLDAPKIEECGRGNDEEEEGGDTQTTRAGSTVHSSLYQ